MKKKLDSEIFDVTYIYDEVVDKEGIILPLRKTNYYNSEHIKSYGDFLALLYKLSPCASNLLQWVVRRMDSNNEVSSNSAAKQHFIDFHSKANGIIKYSDSTVRLAFRELVNNRFITKRCRSTYIVNPELFIKNDNNRINNIKVFLEFECKHKTKMRVQYEFNDEG